MLKLFPDDNPVAARLPRTDRLFLEPFVKKAGEDKQLDAEVVAAHPLIVKWADLESSGKLAKQKETQLQGDFLSEVFGQVLGYSRMVDNADRWDLEQHLSFGQQTPDATLGVFRPNQPAKPLAVVELKGPKIHLDRDRSSGRSAVDQCWDYLINMDRACRWGVVSNMVSFRLYERDSTKRAYEHYSLQSLRDMETFRKFYATFHRKGLIEKTAGSPPRAVRLLEATTNRQREVGDDLYEKYSNQRTSLIARLHHEMGYSVEDSIEMAQRLFDRVIFIAFCEDRELLPRDTLSKAFEVSGFHSEDNPRWTNYRNLFRFVDKGSERHEVPGYNGGLFAQHAIDELELPDEPLTDFFKSLGGYDFADEVNLDVLGHLFERSITELEKLRATGLFGGDADKAQEFAQMPQSAKRKEMGTYYTPPDLTSRIVQYTVDELIDARLIDLAIEHGIDATEAAKGKVPGGKAFWAAALDVVRQVKIVDPACGSGAFLFQAYDALELRYSQILAELEQPGLENEIPGYILNDNLYGVDLSAESVEITQLALWIRSATRDQPLTVLSHNIVRGNSLVDDPEVDPNAFDWKESFPEVFDRPGYKDGGGGFDCVIGNPPWERIKLQEREFFSLAAPQIATATNAKKRRELVAKLEKKDPELFARYTEAKDRASAMLDYCRKSKRYPLTGKGDINLYAVFSELASQIVAGHGRVGMLVPSGIASDKTTKDFFAAIAEDNRLLRLYDFENKKRFFPEIHASFKFCIFNYHGPEDQSDGSRFVFFAHRVEDIENPARRVVLTGEDIALLNPNTRTCPIFRTRRDAEITKAIYRRVPVLIDKKRKKTGNQWGISFTRMFDQTNDAEHFREPRFFESTVYHLEGNHFVGQKDRFVPLYEAKMIQAFDHRAAGVTVESANWFRQGQTKKTSVVEHQNPEFMVIPRWWVDKDVLPDQRKYHMAYKNVSSPTNSRTMIASFIPQAGVSNSAPLISTSQLPCLECCLLANFNCFVLDFVAKQKISNVNMNFFIVEQLPVLAPDAYEQYCLWSRNQTLCDWISERVLKLSCTAEDMLPLADACEYTVGSFKEYDGRLHKWNEQDRAELMAELDAAFFILYGIEREDAEYILSTFKVAQETHPMLKGKSRAEIILEHYDGLRAASLA